MFLESEFEGYRNLEIFERSQVLVQKLFQNQKDQAGKPYLNHLNRVSMDFTDPWTKSLALMHDVLEDTLVTRKDLERLGYDNDFISALEILTNTYSSYQEYIDGIVASKNKVIFQIKIKDLLHNMDLNRLSVVTNHDIHRCEKYIKAYQKIMNALEGEKL